MNKIDYRSSSKTVLTAEMVVNTTVVELVSIALDGRKGA